MWLYSLDSLDSLNHVFNSLIIPIFTNGISVLGVVGYDKSVSKTDKFQGRAVRFGFLKEATPVLSLLDVSDNTFWKSITNSTEISPHLCKTRLLRNRCQSYTLLEIRTERCFIDRGLSSFIYYCQL